MTGSIVSASSRAGTTTSTGGPWAGCAGGSSGRESQYLPWPRNRYVHTARQRKPRTVIQVRPPVTKSSRPNDDGPRIPGPPHVDRRR